MARTTGTTVPTHRDAAPPPSGATPPRQQTAAVKPASPIQIHSRCGAGSSPASPSDARYQYAAAVRAAPTTSAHGSHTNRRRRVRQLIAAQQRYRRHDLHCHRDPPVHQRQVMPELFGQHDGTQNDGYNACDQLPVPPPLLKKIVHRAAHFVVNIVLQPAHLLSLQWTDIVAGVGFPSVPLSLNESLEVSMLSGTTRRAIHVTVNNRHDGRLLC